MAETTTESQSLPAAEKLKQAQRSSVRVLKRQVSQASDFCANRGRNQNGMSNETTKREHYLAQSPIIDHKLLDAILDFAEYDQVFLQCKETQKANH